MARKTIAQAQEVTTFNEEDEAIPEKSVMVDDRTEAGRLADIRAANQDRLVVFAREIESGKQFSCHPVVITDLDFALGCLARAEKKLRLYEKNLETSDV